LFENLIKRLMNLIVMAYESDFCFERNALTVYTEIILEYLMY